MPDWYLAESLRAIAYLIRTTDPTDEQIVRWWTAYVESAPAEEES